MCALGFDNLIIELSDGVFPRKENSVLEIIDTLSRLKQPRSSPKEYFTVDGSLDERVRAIEKPKQPDRLMVQSAEGFIVDYTARFEHRAVGEQHYRFEFSEQGYRDEIAKARGIFFLPFESRFFIDANDYLYYLFGHRLHGITDSNALLIGQKENEHYVNAANHKGVYGREEFVRHKILDAIGALALCGRQFKNTEFRFYMTGHEFDIYALKELFKRGVIIDYNP